MAIKSARAMVEAANARIETIDTEAAARLLGDESVQFVDVRESVEWDQGHIPGAVHAPRGSLEFLADPSLPIHKPELDAGRRLVLYCAAGGRSALAARTLAEMGFTDVCHVAGGYGAWKEAGLEISDER